MVGLLVICEGRRFGVSLGVGSGGCWLVLVIWGLGMVLVFALLRAWGDGEGFHDLHWNMLSWFGFCARVLRGFLFGLVERVVAGGFMSRLGRAVVKRGIGVWVCELVAAYRLVFFGGLFDGSRGGDWEFSWVWVVVCGLLRVVVACEVGSCIELGLEAICVLRLRR